MRLTVHSSTSNANSDHECEQGQMECLWRPRLPRTLSSTCMVSQSWQHAIRGSPTIWEWNWQGWSNLSRKRQGCNNPDYYVTIQLSSTWTTCYDVNKGSCTLHQELVLSSAAAVKINCCRHVWQTPVLLPISWWPFLVFLLSKFRIMTDLCRQAGSALETLGEGGVRGKKSKGHGTGEWRTGQRVWGLGDGWYGEWEYCFTLLFVNRLMWHFLYSCLRWPWKVRYVYRSKEDFAPLV